MAISQKSLDSSSMRKESHSSTHAARTGLRNLQNPWLLKKRRDFFCHNAYPYPLPVVPPGMDRISLSYLAGTCYEGIAALAQ